MKSLRSRFWTPISMPRFCLIIAWMASPAVLTVGEAARR